MSSFGDPDKKEQHAGRLEIRNAAGADWMVDEVYTKIPGRWIGHYVRVFFCLCKMERSKVEHSPSFVPATW